MNDFVQLHSFGAFQYIVILQETRIIIVNCVYLKKCLKIKTAK